MKIFAVGLLAIALLSAGGAFQAALAQNLITDSQQQGFIMYRPDNNKSQRIERDSGLKKIPYSANGYYRSPNISGMNDQEKIHKPYLHRVPEGSRSSSSYQGYVYDLDKDNAQRSARLSSAADKTKPSYSPKFRIMQTDRAFEYLKRQ